MALLEQPVAAIYTQTVGTACSLKCSSPGKIQTKKHRKREEKRDYKLIRDAQRRGDDEEREGMTRQRRKNKETELPRRRKMRKGGRQREKAI